MPQRLARLELQVVIDTVAPDTAAGQVTDHYRLAGHSAAVILVSRSPA